MREHQPRCPGAMASVHLAARAGLSPGRPSRAPPPLPGVPARAAVPRAAAAGSGS
jgi:hypothetical protein